MHVYHPHKRGRSYRSRLSFCLTLIWLVGKYDRAYPRNVTFVLVNSQTLSREPQSSTQCPSRQANHRYQNDFTALLSIISYLTVLPCKACFCVCELNRACKVYRSDVNYILSVTIVSFFFKEVLSDLRFNNQGRSSQTSMEPWKS
jgi:hypothetical protein